MSSVELPDCLLADLRLGHMDAIGFALSSRGSDCLVTVRMDRCAQGERYVLRRVENAVELPLGIYFELDETRQLEAALGWMVRSRVRDLAANGGFVFLYDQDTANTAPQAA